MGKDCFKSIGLAHYRKSGLSSELSQNGSDLGFWFSSISDRKEPLLETYTDVLKLCFFGMNPNQLCSLLDTSPVVTECSVSG